MEEKQTSSKQIESSQFAAVTTNSNSGRRPPLPIARRRTGPAKEMKKSLVLSPICEVSGELVVSDAATAQEPGSISVVEASSGELPATHGTAAEVAAAEVSSTCDQMTNEQNASGNLLVITGVAPEAVRSLVVQTPNCKLPASADTPTEVAAAEAASCDETTAIAAAAAAAAPTTQPLQRKDLAAGPATPEVQLQQERKPSICAGTGKRQSTGRSRIPVPIARVKSEAATKLQKAAAAEITTACSVAAPAMKTSTEGNSSSATAPHAHDYDATTPPQPACPAAASGGRSRRRPLACPANSAAAGSGSRGDVRRQAAGASDASAVNCRAGSAGGSKLAPRPAALPPTRSLTTTIVKGQTRTITATFGTAVAKAAAPAASVASTTTHASRLTSGRSQSTLRITAPPLPPPPPPLPPPLMLTAAANSYGGGRQGPVAARGCVPPPRLSRPPSSSRVAKPGIYSSGPTPRNAVVAAAGATRTPAITKLSDWLAGDAATAAARSAPDVRWSTFERRKVVNTRSVGGATPPRLPRVADAGCRSRSMSPSLQSKMAGKSSARDQTASMVYLSRRICGDTLRPEPPIRVPASKPHLRYTSPSSSSSSSSTSIDEKEGAKGYAKKSASKKVRSQRGKSQPLRVRYRAKFAYKKWFDFDICFAANDVIEDCIYLDRVWIIGTVKRTKQRGLIPRNHLSKMKPFKQLYSDLVLLP